MMRFTHIRNIWNETDRRYDCVEFIIEFDPEELPHKMFTKAVYSKSGKSKLGGGAITVKVQK